jgi:hypothetical protein
MLLDFMTADVKDFASFDNRGFCARVVASFGSPSVLKATITSKSIVAYSLVKGVIDGNLVDCGSL